LENLDFSIKSLGPAQRLSPVHLSNRAGDMVADYVHEDEYVIYKTDAVVGQTITYKKQELLEKAGPRERIYFDPQNVHAGIITCGGLCPGLNDVIRSIVMTLWYQYGVKRISGIRFGYRGLIRDYNIPMIELTPDIVTDIHQHGGTILGSSRGGGDRVSEMVDTIENAKITMLFTIGGDGTQKGSLRIAEEIERRGLQTVVVGIPKTIDNDLSFIEKSFGFETAVGKAVEAVAGAHVEAHDAVNGIGIVKLMGRESGFIAAYTTLATNDVNYVLVPEVPFELDGPNGLLLHLKNRLSTRNHALIVVAEGAGQELMAKESAQDASGNKKFADIGIYLKDRISSYFASDLVRLRFLFLFLSVAFKP